MGSMSNQRGGGIRLLKRIYHPYHKWEEHKAGMWRNVQGTEREKFLKEAIEFTGNAELYGKWMMKVVEEWPFSCEHNLSCLDMNRQAWIGHAAGLRGGSGGRTPSGQTSAWQCFGSGEGSVLRLDLVDVYRTTCLC